MINRDEIVKSAVTKSVAHQKTTAIGVIDFQALKSSVNDLYAAFPDNFVHAFAVKANPLVEVLKKLYQLGMDFEVASLGELALVKAAGIPYSLVVFDCPVKTKDDLDFCLEQGIAINIDNLQELERLDQLVQFKSSLRSVIGFRINPQVGVGRIHATSTATLTSKFGYPILDEGNYEQLMSIYINRPWLSSLHTHIGSQGIDLNMMIEGILKMVNLAEEVNYRSGFQQIKYLDIGGGLPVNFMSDEIKPSFFEYANLLKDKIPVLFSGKYQVKTEFGRSIIAKTGLIITRVEYSKSVGGRHVVATYAGSNIATRTAYVPALWPLRAFAYESSGSPKKSKQVKTDIGGPCCFSGDLIVRDYLLPKLDVNDFVAIPDTGAYCFTNHFEYNCFPRIAVYSFNNGVFNCIRPAASMNDIVKSFSS